jgi:hypothetical protein
MVGIELCRDSLWKMGKYPFRMIPKGMVIRRSIENPVKNERKSLLTES